MKIQKQIMQFKSNYRDLDLAKYKADILPVAICGFSWYATKLFQRDMTIKIGTLIPHTLSEKEIIHFSERLLHFPCFNLGV